MRNLLRLTSGALAGHRLRTLLSVLGIAAVKDFTITTQQAMLDVFGNVARIVTMAVGAIGDISLLVGAVGNMTMMWIAVGERTAEIRLLRVVGAQRTQVLGLFLAEAGVLARLGGALGLALGFSVSSLLRAFFRTRR